MQFYTFSNFQKNARENNIVNPKTVVKFTILLPYYFQESWRYWSLHMVLQFPFPLSETSSFCGSFVQRNHYKPWTISWSPVCLSVISSLQWYVHLCTHMLHSCSAGICRKSCAKFAPLCKISRSTDVYSRQYLLQMTGTLKIFVTLIFLMTVH